MTATEETTDLPWHLTGNNAPVSDELTVTELDVRGAIPSELSGRYFRNGANPQSGFSEHWFLGDGMLHGVEISGGKANWYRNRYVRTPMYANPEGDRMEMSMNPETLEMDYTVSAANTHIIKHAGKILALEEGAFPYEITNELDTVGPVDFEGKLGTPFTAHPKMCPETGEIMAFGYGYLPPHLTYLRLDAEGNLVQSEEITVGGPTMIHDFAVSRNHAIFMDLPAVFDLEVAMNGGMPIGWSDDYPARFGVMPRAGSNADVQWFDIDPCYVFHTLNAWDDGDEVVVTAARLREIWRNDTSIGEGTSPDGMQTPMLWEWRLNRATGKVSESQLDDQGAEFPRVADSKAGFNNRYGYLMSQGEDGHGAVLKYDLANGASKTSHVFPDGQTPGEPVFVPAEGGTNEDDGYLMTYVHDAGTDTSHMVILDATDMAAEPLAEIHMPVRIPTGFHGSWIADD